MDKIKLLPLKQIVPGNNDRKDFALGPLIELARSISDNGLAQPITVRPCKGGMYEIVAGERRYRAHQLYTEKVESGEWERSEQVEPGFISSIIRPLSDDEAASIMLIENLSRKDLNPIEEANAYNNRLGKFGWSMDHLCKTTGKKAGYISNRLRLLDLAADIQELVKYGHIPLSHANLMTSLDVNRQHLCVKLLNNGNVNLATFRKYVNQLVEEQSQDSLFDLTEFWMKQVQDDAYHANGKKAKVDVPRSRKLPAPTYKYNEPAGDIIHRYIYDLMEAGHEDEAKAVGNLYEALVRNRNASLPSYGK